MPGDIASITRHTQCASDALEIIIAFAHVEPKPSAMSENFGEQKVDYQLILHPNESIVSDAFTTLTNENSIIVWDVKRVRWKLQLLDPTIRRFPFHHLYIFAGESTHECCRKALGCHPRQVRRNYRDRRGNGADAYLMDLGREDARIGITIPQWPDFRRQSLRGRSHNISISEEDRRTRNKLIKSSRTRMYDLDQVLLLNWTIIRQRTVYFFIYLRYIQVCVCVGNQIHGKMTLPSNSNMDDMRMKTNYSGGGYVLFRSIETIFDLWKN